MIDERHQELASLYAFNLLEGAERIEFEKAMTREPELQSLVSELRNTAAMLGHAAPPTELPPSLRERVLASAVGAPGPARSEAPPVPASPQRTWRTRIIPWTLAAGFAAGAAWLGDRYNDARLKNQRLATHVEVADVALKAAQTQLEAERLLGARVASEFNALKATSAQQLGAADEALTHTRQQLAAVRQSQARSEQAVADLRQSQASLTSQLTAAERSETQAKAELVALSARTKDQDEFARLKIATLASPPEHSPAALAVAVWDPKQQQGVLAVDKLPANSPDQRYELWVIDTKPVSAGVFSVNSDGHARITFKPTLPVKSATRFAVSREKNDGLPAHTAPAQVVMISP